MEKIMNRRDVLKSIAAIAVVPTMLMASPAKPKLRVISSYIKKEFIYLWGNEYQTWVDRLYMTLSNGHRMVSWVGWNIIREDKTGLYTGRDSMVVTDWSTNTYHNRDFDAAEIFASRYFGVEDIHAGIPEYADLY
jgi:hypothetical protein